MPTNADIKFPIIIDDSDSEVEVSHARFYSAMHSKDREYRQRAFFNHLQPYKHYKIHLQLCLMEILNRKYLLLKPVVINPQGKHL